MKSLQQLQQACSWAKSSFCCLNLALWLQRGKLHFISYLCHVELDFWSGKKKKKSTEVHPNGERVIQTKSFCQIPCISNREYSQVLYFFFLKNLSDSLSPRVESSSESMFNVFPKEWGTLKIIGGNCYWNNVQAFPEKPCQTECHSTCLLIDFDIWSYGAISVPPGLSFFFFCCVQKYFKRSNLDVSKVSAWSKSVSAENERENNSNKRRSLAFGNTYSILLLFRAFFSLISVANFCVTDCGLMRRVGLKVYFTRCICVIIIYFNQAAAYCALLTSPLMEWLVTVAIICQFLWVWTCSGFSLRFNINLLRKISPETEHKQKSNLLPSLPHLLAFRERS